MVELNYYANDLSFDEGLSLVIEHVNGSVFFDIKQYGEFYQRISFDLSTAKVLSDELQALVSKMESNGRLD
jgi:hypothetical protein